MASDQGFEAESRNDRQQLHEDVRRLSDANAKAHEDLHLKIDKLAEKVDEAITMLKIGRAGIAFIKFVSAVGASIAAVWVALFEIGKHK